MSAPRQTITRAWVDDAVARRDADQLTEAVLWCWASSDDGDATAFEQVLEVFGGSVGDIADPRNVHRSTLSMLTASASTSATDFAAGDDIADLAIDTPAVVFDVIGQWCRHVLISSATETP